MVKFGKQLEAQLVQEWRSAYVDYKQLKRSIRHLKRSMQGIEPVHERWHEGPVTPKTPKVSDYWGSESPRLHTSKRFGSPRFSRGFTEVHEAVTDSFKHASGRAADFLRSRPISKKIRKSPDLIKVERRVSTVGEHDEVYETTLNENVGELEEPFSDFFSRLDADLNKVNEFYRKKEKEFVEHYERLKNQVEALEEIRVALKRGSSPPRDVTENSDKPDRPKTIAEAVEGVYKRLESQRLLQVRPQVYNIIDNKSKTPEEEFVAISVADGRSNPAVVQSTNSDVTVEMPEIRNVQESEERTREGGSIGSSRDAKGTSRQMRLNIPLSTPGTAIKTLTHLLWEDLQRQGGLHKHSNSNDVADFTVSKRNVVLAERMLRNAFFEYYRGLTMLKSYSSLNLVAFSKILKKFDKVAGCRALPIYIRVVESSYFNTSDKSVILTEKVEHLFAKSFAKNDRSRARLHLRPPQKKTSHKVTFLLGLFTGGSLAFIAVFFVLLERMLGTYIAPFHALESQAPAPEQQFPESIYLKTIFPLFCLTALILIHMFAYGFNLYFWRKWRINYAFMFDFKQGTELRPGEVLMMSSIMMTLLLASLVGHLALHSVSDSFYVDLIPLGVFGILVSLLFLPFNIFYRSARLFVLTAFMHLALAPLYKVVLVDFFLGDQLTSQVPAIRNFQYLLCYYTGGFFRRADADGCITNETFKGLVYLGALLPYWWRTLQCMRRFVEEHGLAHVANALKYVSAMLAVGLKIQHTRNSNLPWTVVFITVSILATVYQTYWDIWIDWGLMRRDSKNKWLRDDLIMPKHKSTYFLAMIVNVILRLAWLQSITRWRFGLVGFQVADFTFAVLEVIRRGIWNFFRMENEHLNNVGRYRATKAVPLPFEDPAREIY